jgi:hypothetical protein
LRNLFIGLGEWLDNLIVGLLLIHLLLLFVTVLLSGISKLILQLLDDIEVGVGDLIVVVLDFSVLLSVLGSELGNGCILFLLDHSDLRLSLVLHFSA